MSNKIKSMSFNYDSSCFAVCGTSGVHILATDPLVHLVTIDSSLVGGCVRRVEMLDRTNLLALLYDGLNPDCAENVVRIWDNALKRFILQFSFPEVVQTVRLLNPFYGTFMLVATSNRLYVYRLLPEVAAITQFDTAEMAPMRLALSVTPSETRFAFPILLCTNDNIARRTVSPSLASGKSAISIRALEAIIHQFESRTAMADEPRTSPEGSEQSRTTARLGPSSTRALNMEALSRMPITIQAHQNAIAVIALSRDGAYLATASLKGTLIRVFSVSTTKKLLTFRRGVDESLHFALAFSNDSRFLVSASQKGTVHIFSLDSSAARQQRSNSLGGFFLDELKSIASFVLTPETETLIALGSLNEPLSETNQQRQLVTAGGVTQPQHFCIYSVLRDGTYHKHVVAADGSTCVRTAFERFDELFGDDM